MATPKTEKRVAEESETITLTRDELNAIKGQIYEMDEFITRIMSSPLVYASVVSAKNQFDLSVFEKGDRLIVIDKNLKKEKKTHGHIASDGVDKDGWLVIEYPNQVKENVNIGLNGELPQVKLVGKDDGTNVVIAHDGKLVEVHGLPGRKFHPTDIVKVDIQSLQIHDGADLTTAGDIVGVKAVLDETHIEVDDNGKTRAIINMQREGSKPIEPGDRVMLDHTSMIAVRVLPKANNDCYNLVEQSNVSWDNIAGLGDVKGHLVEALETPYREPAIYKFYNKTPPKGVLLYGPPGCGKTLCAKAAANSMAKIHGKTNYQSGFIYVKGPELLSKWVGQAEQSIRELFIRGREHYKVHKYPALLFIDEADALLPQRGSGVSSDIADTIVPMFLSEMDGLQESHLMVMLATNQPKRLDPAVVREGRVDRHIKVCRPTIKNAHEYFALHMQNIPFEKGFEPEELAALTIKDLFSEHRGLYNLKQNKKNWVFTLGDTVSGAMIKGVVDQATSIAMKRDLSNNTQTGVTRHDLQGAVDLLYTQHADLNPTFDLQDFYDLNGIDKETVIRTKFVPSI